MNTTNRTTDAQMTAAVELVNATRAALIEANEALATAWARGGFECWQAAQSAQEEAGRAATAATKAWGYAYAGY